MNEWNFFLTKINSNEKDQVSCLVSSDLLNQNVLYMININNMLDRKDIHIVYMYYVS